MSVPPLEDASGAMTLGKRGRSCGSATLAEALEEVAGEFCVCVYANYG